MSRSPARAPRAVPPGRIASLATLPVFYKLAGRRVVVAGEGEGAVWKAELLCAAGARVAVFVAGDPAPYEALARGDGELIVVRRSWLASDLHDAALAIGECESEEEASAFAAAARAAGVPVNIIDRPAFCDFQFGAIVNRSPLVVAISTDGAAPVFGQSIRAKIEAMLPAGLKRWAEAARDWRPDVQARGPSFAQRRSFWERFADLAWGAIDRAPTPADRDALLGGLAPHSSPQGRVTLVGAGPGDPELLTLKAVRALQAADVILYDDLVGTEVLDFARREAKRLLVGKTGHGPSCKQDDINRMMVSLARQGRHVVRLKGGDPLLFGRATEEIEACHAAGVAVSIVPGVTAAQGAAAALGVSLTERGKARRVQFVTGHDARGKLPEDIAWSALAERDVTTAVYMPRRTIAELAAKAMAAGLDPKTPAVAIAGATRPGQAVVRATVATLAGRLATLPDGQPVLALFGETMKSVSDSEFQALGQDTNRPWNTNTEKTVLRAR